MYPIRKALTADAQAIVLLRNAAIRSESAGHYADATIQAWTTGDTPSERFCQAVEASFYVAEVDGKVVASGALDVVSGKLDAIFVCPQHARRGIGKAMLAFLEQLAREAGLQALSLESTLNAVTFYRAAGFVGDGISQYHSPRGFSMDCVAMQKRLGRAMAI